MSPSLRDAFSREVEKRLARLRALARVCSFAGGVILLVLAFVGLGSSVVPRIMGLQPYAIISGSMEPAYPTGSLVYAQPVSGEDLRPGEVAAFWRDGDVIVHRVDSIDATEKEFVAKGDANDDVNALSPFTRFSAAWCSRCPMWDTSSWRSASSKASYFSAG